MAGCIARLRLRTLRRTDVLTPRGLPTLHLDISGQPASLFAQMCYWVIVGFFDSSPARLRLRALRCDYVRLLLDRDLLGEFAAQDIRGFFDHLFEDLMGRLDIFDES